MELSKMQDLGNMMDTDGDGLESMDAEEPQTDLWVEKFRPRSYLELLSDDGTNRVLLKWLKLWDKVVFGREVKVRNKNKKEEEGSVPATATAFNKDKKEKKDGDAPVNKKPFQFFDIDDEMDSAGRPKQKVALLHGPPGLGKTTLAHIIATHAGYNVVEMNASDDRSLQAFKNKMENATQMRSVNSKDQGRHSPNVSTILLRFFLL
jgi:chromosome transmission fidelity protein 18